MATEQLAAPRSAVRARVSPVVLLAGGALLLIVAVRIWMAGNIVTPWILLDELIYGEMARSFAESGDLLVRGVPAGTPAVLYPVAISPAWLVTDTIPHAYGLAKAINVVVMTAVVVPVWFWARRLVPPLWALAAVALVLVMPSMLYTGVLMSENAFFPLFVASAFAMAAALERPAVWRQAVVFVPVGLAIGVRVQAIVLLAVLPAAILVKALLDALAPGDGPRGRRALATLRAFWPTFAVLAAGAVLFAGYESARGRSLASALGSYADVARADYALGTVLHWLTLHFAELAFSVGVVPACALLLLVGIAAGGRSTTPAERAFLAVATAAVPLVVLQVALFASRFSLRIEERYMFPLAPLFFLALVLWIARGLERPPVLAVAAAVVPVLLLLDVKLKDLLGVQILSDTFALIPVWRAAQLLDGGVDAAQTLLLAGSVVAAAAFLFVPRRFAVVLPLGVAAFLAFSSWPVYGAVRDYARSLAGYAGAGDRDWIDDAAGGGVHAPYLYDAARVPGYDDMILWQTEFWNGDVGDVVRLGPQVRDPLVEQVGSVDPATGAITAPGIGSPRYAVTSSGLTLAGKPLASKSLLTLYRVQPPLRLASSVEGVYGDGWMGAQAAYSGYTGGPGRMSVTLSREAWGGKDVPGKVTVRVGPAASNGAGGAQIGKVTAQKTLTLHRLQRHVVTLPTPKAPYRVEVAVAPTFSPADYGLSDTRELGAQVVFRPLPPR